MDADPPPVLTVEPIGHVRTALATRVDAPRQPPAAGAGEGVIRLLPGRNFEHALEDLAGWEMIWVVFWFHLNPGWRPKVLPPRSRSGRKGVFATRSPHRPNPIGLSAVRLLGVDGLDVRIAGADMVDGTPVLDLKPYVPYTDAHPAARSGWLDDAARAAADALADPPADPVPGWEVAFEPLAAGQAAWVEARTGLDLRARIATTLALGPQPHAYRRIRREGAGFRLAVQAWRARFTVAGRAVRVLAIESGYRPAVLAAAPTGGAADDRADLAVHRAFAAAWPGAGPAV